LSTLKKENEKVQGKKTPDSHKLSPMTND